MKWLGKPKDEEEVSYWQTISDVLSALLLILLLIIMLLIMYVVLVPENENIDLDLGDHYDYYDHHADYEYGSSSPSPSPTETPTPTPTPSPTPYWNNGGGGGGGGGYGGNGNSDFREQGITEDEGFPKAAVYVKVIDGETRRAIREEGVTFIFLDDDRGQVVLNTYYPQTISFLEYSTTEFGVFFLPEKIQLGNYTIRQTTEPQGYDRSEDIDFTIDEEHDWDEPYIIEVELFPSRNVIRVQNVDSITGRPVEGGIYDVYAAEDIITADGTLRYAAGAIVDEIECDDTGAGRSEELFLGTYSVLQREPPQYYASILEPTESSVLKKQETRQSAIHTMVCQRTRAIIDVRDALYGTISIPNATFQVTNMPGIANFEVSSDENGRILLDELAKGTTYTLRQLTTAEGYRFDDGEYSFTIGSDGRIDGETTVQMEVLNTTLRLAVTVRDILLRNQVSDYSVTLYSQNDEIIKIWNSSATAEVTEGLAPGRYRIVVNGGGIQEQEIILEDSVEIQYVDCYVLTNSSLVAAAVLVVLIGLVITLIVALRKRRSRKTKK